MLTQSKPRSKQLDRAKLQHGYVYVIKLYEPLPLTKAQYYLGSTNNLSQRLKQHRRGGGSPMIRRAMELRIGCELAIAVETSTISQARAIEAKLKRWKNNRLAVDWLRDFSKPGLGQSAELEVRNLISQVRAGADQSVRFELIQRRQKLADLRNTQILDGWGDPNHFRHSEHKQLEQLLSDCDRILFGDLVLAS